MQHIVILTLIILTTILLCYITVKRAWIWHIFHGNKNIYLTFDDGPQEELTYTLLQLLEQEQVKATFFCVGDAARRYPQQMAAIRQHGHAIGNHTMHHLKGWTTPYHAYMQNVAEAQPYLQATCFRPPYGKITLRQWLSLRKQYRIVLWTHISHDWDTSYTPQRCLHKVLTAATRGGIVVFHDNPKARENMLPAVTAFIHIAKQHGMQFKTLEQ